MSASERGKYRLPLKSQVPAVERWVRQEGEDGKELFSWGGRGKLPRGGSLGINSAKGGRFPKVEEKLRDRLWKDWRKVWALASKGWGMLQEVRLQRQEGQEHSACLGRSHCGFLGFILRTTCLAQGYFKSGPRLTLGGLRKAVVKSERILVLLHLTHFPYPYRSSLCDLIQS